VTAVATTVLKFEKSRGNVYVQVSDAVCTLADGSTASAAPLPSRMERVT